MNGIQLEGFEPAVKARRGADGRITEGLQVGDTLRQNQALILVLHKGELKERLPYDELLPALLRYVEAM